MKKIYLLTLLIALGSQYLFAQNSEKAFGISFKGFVKHEMIYDSRQTVTSRDGTVLFFPSAISKDVNGEDINADPQFNMLAITSRLQGVITGPEAFGAKTSGMISCDFVGTGTDKVVLPRLRQAFVKLAWENSSLVLGKAWHPLFVTDVFPQVLTFGAAIPFYTLNRAPQITYTYNIKGLSMALSATTQDDFKSVGPNGRSCSYLVNSGRPELNARVMYKSEHFLIGAAAGFWTLKPTLTNGIGAKATETVNGMLVNTFAKVTLDNIIVRGGYLFGENMSQLMMFGGFGVSAIDEVTGEQSYAATKASSMWADVQYNHASWSFGLFGGYTQNDGADEKIIGSLYALAPTIDNYMRVSPRITYTSGKVKVGLEGIYHVAAYGSLDEYAKVIETTESGAVRILTSVAYIF